MGDRLFKTMDEAVAAAKEVRASKGYMPLPSPDPIHAMWGIGAWRPLTPEERSSNCVKTRRGPTSPEVRFLWPRFDRPFEAIIRQVTPPAYTETLASAQPDRFASDDVNSRQLLQACTYDLEKGLSFVSQLSLVELRRFYRDTWIYASMGVRLALGGYGQARWDMGQRILAALDVSLSLI